MSCSPSFIIAMSHAAILAFCASGVKTSLIADSQKKAAWKQHHCKLRVSLLAQMHSRTHRHKSGGRDRREGGRERERERE